VIKWTTACPDWEQRIVAGRSLLPCPPLFPGPELDLCLEIFRGLRIVDAPGSPTIGEACLPWAFDLPTALFGALDPNLGRRLIQNFMLLVSKKNSKSTLAPAIMLTALLRNFRESGEFIILAPTIEVAGNSFKPARDMVKADPELEEILLVQEHIKTITHRGTNATLKVVAADADTVSGIRAIGILVEELWLFGKRVNAEAMLREATGGLASRPEGFVIYLSTQSDQPPAGVFRDRLHHFRNVRDGIVIDRKSLGLLYEFPETMLKNDSYLDPANFYITNPNLGRSVDREFLVDEVRKAQEAGASSLALVAAKHLNAEVGIALKTDRWTGADYWARQADPTLTREEILNRSEVVIVGIDGGGLDDLFGLAVLGRDKKTHDWLLWSHAWAHRGVLERRKSIASVLLDFEKAGELTIVDDSLGDIAGIVGMVDEIKRRGILGAVAADPAGLGILVDELAAVGITEENKLLIGVGQGYRMMNAIKTAERRLANGTLRHSGSKLMAWCVANLKIEPTATAIRATKQNAGDAKIDPVMAMFDAIDQMALNPPAAGSIYDDAEAYERVFGARSADGSPARDFDPAILADINHPAFKEQKARFERWQAMQGDDEF